MSGIDLNAILQIVSILAIPVVFAITLHEVAHGWAAKQLGDPTAYKLGRLSLNPLRHVDPIGTVVVPLGLAFMTGGQWYFGWAKPVPVQYSNLRNQRRDLVLVAAAGPGANLVMATAWTLAYIVSVMLGAGAIVAGAPADDWIIRVCTAGIYFNCLLMVFNLLPVPPLDGSKVLAGLLPPRGAEVIHRIEPFGLIIVLLLMLPPIAVLWTVMEPIMRFFMDFFFGAIRDLT
jgi:Zn-dependent protease